MDTKFGEYVKAKRLEKEVNLRKLAELLGITERSVQRNIQNLQRDGLLRRVGGRKEGHWEVIE